MAARRPRAGNDLVFVRGLEVRAVVGVDAWERTGPQTLVIDLETVGDAARAARRDDVRDAVNYRTLAKEAQAFVARRKDRLVETLADRLAAHLLRRLRLPWIRVRIEKPGAVRFSRVAGVEVERGRRPDDRDAS